MPQGNNYKKTVIKMETGVMKELISKYKKDVVLMSAIIVIAVLTFVIYFMSNKSAASEGEQYYIIVTMNNRTELVVPYGQAGTYEFENQVTGLKNVLVVKEDGVYVEHADCPDQICVMQGVINKEDYFLPIACLPNRFIVEIGTDIPKDYKMK